MATGCRHQLWSGQIHRPAFNLEGNAPCGPACGVLWEPGERSPRRPDYVAVSVWSFPWVASHLPTEVWVIAFPPDHCTETVVSALMRGVVAGLAEDHAVVHGVRSAELDVPEMMGLRTFTEFVLRSSRLPEAGNVGATAGAPESLTSVGELLSCA